MVNLFAFQETFAYDFMTFATKFDIKIATA